MHHFPERQEPQTCKPVHTGCQNALPNPRSLPNLFRARPGPGTFLPVWTTAGLESLVQCCNPSKTSPLFTFSPKMRRRKYILLPAGCHTPAFWDLPLETFSSAVPRHDMAEYRFCFLLAEIQTFHTQINIISSHCDTIMSFLYTGSDIFMKSVHPSQLRGELALLHEHTAKCGLLRI